MADSAARTRNARACEACRASKSRCIYTSNRETCQRCAESGGSCVVRAKARPMRTRAPRSTTNSDTLGNTKFLLDLPALPSRDINQDIEDLNAHHRHMFGDEDSQGSRSTAPPEPQELIKPRKITLNEAQGLLTTYREIAVGFPFVQIPEHATVHVMSRDSPFLLLAVLIAASRYDPNLHHQLAHEFRRVLSQNLVVEGKKNLDLLQSLLVYVAWYPIHSNPKNSQTFVFMDLTVSLALDLGADNEYPNLTGFTPLDTTGLVEAGIFTKAAKRAFLGCYYLSSAFSMGFHKRNSMQGREVTDARCVEVIQEDPLSEVGYSFKLQRLWERISDFYSAADKEGTNPNSTLNPEIETLVFLNELEDFRRMTPELIQNMPYIVLFDRLTYVIIYAYNLGLLRRFYQVKTQMQGPPRIISHEYKCLEGCKAFFEYLFSLPESIFITFSTLQWTLVVHCTMVLSRLTFVMAADAGWDSHTTRANIPMIMYLDCLCWRFQKLSSASSEPLQSKRSIDPMYVFGVIFESLKKSYSRRLAEIQAPAALINQRSPAPISRGECPFRDPDVSAFFASEFSDSNSSFGDTSTPGSGIFPVYHDIWSTMTGAWADP